jgi:hypothetical protein
MKTPVRTVRIEDELWRKADQVAEDLAARTGLSATASDVVRLALVEYVERHKVAKRSQRQGLATNSSTRSDSSRPGA